MCVCAGSMDVDVEGIIQCIKQGDEMGVQIQLQEFNKEVTAHRKSHIIMYRVLIFVAFADAVCSPHSTPSASSLMWRRGIDTE